MGYISENRKSPLRQKLKKTFQKSVKAGKYLPNRGTWIDFTYEGVEPYTAKKPFTVFLNDAENNIRLLQGDCVEIMNRAGPESIDMIFADPPYFLSNGGITCQAGRMVSVNKGNWDKSKGLKENHKFNLAWLKACQRVLKPDGSIWVSGTVHNIYSVGFALQELGYKSLNEICWYKPNAAPNLSTRYFTHSHEAVIWAAKSEKTKHKFNYQLMKQINGGKQMRSLWMDLKVEENPQDIWIIPTPARAEKEFGKHPTQKPLALLERIVLASTDAGDLILDPFTGSSTTGVAALKHGRRFIGIDSDTEYLGLSEKRLLKEVELKTEKPRLQMPPV